MNHFTNIERKSGQQERTQRARRRLIAASVVWLALGALVFVVVVAGVSTLTVFIPVFATVIGYALFAMNGALYIEYLMWVWFLTPLARRLVDYAQGVYTPTSLIIASPTLVGTACVIFLLVALVRGRLSMSSPFAIPLVALAFAFVIGLKQNGAVAAFYDLLAWSVPIAVGYYLTQNWQQYPRYRDSVQRVFVAGGFVLGLYGIIQFVLLPPWDQLWMTGSAMTSIGKPEPFEVRIFGTLNSPGPYGFAMLASVAIMTASRNVVSLSSALIALLLSLVRTAWGGLFVALVWIASQAHGRERVRLFGVATAGAFLVVVLLVQYEPMQEVVLERFETLSAIGDDGSAQARIAAQTGRGPRWVLSNPLGRGLGAAGTVAQVGKGQSFNIDSGIFQIPIVLGIPGMLLYYWGVFVLLKRFVWHQQPDAFLRAASGVVLAILAMLLFANQFTGFKGTLFWAFLGLVVAGRTYYESRYQY